MKLGKNKRAFVKQRKEQGNHTVAQSETEKTDMAVRISHRDSNLKCELGCSIVQVLEAAFALYRANPLRLRSRKK
jgi:hypothetical protein